MSDLLLPSSRLETLADGIFAIAMTLLVLSIEVPSLPGSVTPIIFKEYVISIIPQVLMYIISFILLAVFWMNHHIFFTIKRVNTTLLWINIFWLMSIAIVPFSTSIIGKYGQFQLAQLIFDLNIFIIGISFYLNWYYAARKEFINDNVLPYTKEIQRTNLSQPIIAIIAIIVSFITPIGSIFIFILIPAIFTLYALRKKRFKDKVKDSQSNLTN